MLIDINYAKDFFSEYVKNYDYKDKQVKLKIMHIERVSQMAKKLTIELDLSEEEIKLADIPQLLKEEINPILLCYEKDQQFCHRHIVAEYLELMI